MVLGSKKAVRLTALVPTTLKVRCFAKTESWHHPSTEAPRASFFSLHRCTFMARCEHVNHRSPFSPLSSGKITPFFPVPPSLCLTKMP